MLFVSILCHLYCLLPSESYESSFYKMFPSVYWKFVLAVGPQWIYFQMFSTRLPVLFQIQRRRNHCENDDNLFFPLWRVKLTRITYFARVFISKLICKCKQTPNFRQITRSDWFWEKTEFCILSTELKVLNVDHSINAGFSRWDESFRMVCTYS